MKEVKTDVLVIGAGAAGSMAAIRASEFIRDILVLPPSKSGMGTHPSSINPSMTFLKVGQ